MLLELRVEHFALIDDLWLPFGEGLHVFTGETGSGKSLLIDALQLALGQRASQENIRSGREEARVRLVCDLRGRPQARELLAAWGVTAEPDEPVVITREVQRGGRSTCRVNGQVVTAQMVRELMEGLVELHSQHEQQRLARPERQRALLDRYGGPALAAAWAAYSAAWRALRDVEEEARSLPQDPEERRRQAEAWRLAVEEIDRIAPQPGELDRLRERRRQLLHGEQLARSAQEAYAALYEGGAGAPSSARDQLAAAARAIGQALPVDPSLRTVADLLATAQAHVEEAGHELRRYSESLNFEPDALAALDERLQALRLLEQKYGPGVEAIVQYRASAAAALEELAQVEDRLAGLARRRQAAEEEVLACGRELSKQRQEAAQRLAEAVEQQLGGLGLASSRFAAWLEPNAGGPGPDGLERVRFAVGLNPGEPLTPLAQTASGGEMSRLLLALRTALADADDIPVLVFDEIDAGVGGETALAVAHRLSRLAAHRQVLCVTHLPQVAAAGKRHYHMEKIVEGGRTRTAVSLLDEDQRLEELARMLGGRLATAREHARELLRLAQVG